MSDSEVVAALPSAGNANHALLRNFLIKRVVYPFASTEDVQAFEALDSDTGAIPIAISKYGNLYALDPDDTTTAHDDNTCQVSQDGYRYKVQGIGVRVSSVIDKDLTTPPSPSDSPPVSLGDAYLVPNGATGDWAAFEEHIAVWTARGWVFEAPSEGRLIYVEDEDSYYHYNVDGDWAGGVGQSALATESVKVKHLLGTGRNLHFTVVNQTTNAPPSLTGSGNVYVVGSSPTGAWAGKAGYIAVDEDTEWGLYQPSEGWRVYDQALNADYTYSGTAWAQSSGLAASIIFNLSGRNSSAISGNISSVNTTTEVITWSTNHGLTTGQLVAFATTSGLPTGLTADTPYYVRALSSNTLAVYTTLTDANSDTNRIDLSSSGAGTMTIKLYSGITEISKSGVSSAELIAGISTITFKVNFATNFPSVNYLALPAGMTAIAGFSATSFGGSSAQPKTKAVGSVTFQCDVASTILSTDTIQFQVAIMKV